MISLRVHESQLIQHREIIRQPVNTTAANLYSKDRKGNHTRIHSEEKHSPEKCISSCHEMNMLQDNRN